MILIIGHRKDPHVSAVTRELRRVGHLFTIIDSYSKLGDGLHHRVASGVTLDIGGMDKILLSEVTAVWWRQKPKFAIPAETPSALYDYFFVHREWNQIIDYLGAETRHVFSINDRDRAAAANNKLVQLKLAAAAGLEIPRTLVSNDSDSIVKFVEDSVNKRYIFKPFTPYMPPTGLITFTSLVDAATLLAARDSLSVSPGIFQEFVEKQCELRISVVGDEVFAARINSKYSIHSEVDWRQDQFNDMYAVHEIDGTFAERLLAFHRKLGLFFAAYDFVVNKDGKLVFLEVNPAGQWMWLELRLNLPISERIATALANPPGID